MIEPVDCCDRCPCHYYELYDEDDPRYGDHVCNLDGGSTKIEDVTVVPEKCPLLQEPRLLQIRVSRDVEMGRDRLIEIIKETEMKIRVLTEHNKQLGGLLEKLDAQKANGRSRGDESPVRATSQR